MKKAFTLAEVLITLGIIGVVAALTMPSLIAKYKEKETVSKLKKVYSTFANAYLMAREEQGTPDNWYSSGENYNTAAASNKMVNIFLPYFKVAKVCKQSSGCFPNVIYKKPNNTNDSNFDTYPTISRFILADGTSVYFFSYGSTPRSLGSGYLSESYGAMTVDINGKAGPNKWGVDLFSFALTKNGVVPSGIPDGTGETNFPAACNRTSVTGRGEACTAWVIYNENMDYLRCDGLSWGGKTKCD